MFVQGRNCFFRKSPVAKADGSTEHLFARANGGGNNDENCVACCKALNSVLGSLSLKEKFQVVLNQKGNFKCPSCIGARECRGHRHRQGQAAIPENAEGASGFSPDSRQLHTRLGKSPTTWQFASENT